MAQVNASHKLPPSTAKLNNELNGFIIDSGCTRHMSPFATDFINLKALPANDVTIRGVAGEISASGVGEIFIAVSTATGKKVKLILRDALYAPELPARFPQRPLRCA